MYKKRAEYIGRIGYPLVRIQSVTSNDVRKSFELLADAYCAPKIFVNLPAYSRLLVTKVTEVMACGTFLLTPRLDHPTAQRNMLPFENGRHLVYYDPEAPENLAAIIRHYLANPKEREAIAAAGQVEVVENHAMHLPLMKIIQDAEMSAAATAAAAEIDPWEAAISVMSGAQ